MAVEAPGRRLRLSRRVAALAAGDLAVFLLFPLLGSLSHDMDLTVGAVLRTNVPFGVAWLLVAPWLGAYRLPVMSQPTVAWRMTLVAWLPAGVLALAMRTWLLDRPFDIAFALVALGITDTLLVAWRVTYALLTRRDGA